MIVSKKYFVQGHKDRLNFTVDIMDHFKNKIDYYGFGIKELKNKRDAIDPYLFSIAIENSQHENYWTEKIADVYLGHTMPIYHGCKNINKFFPSKSLVNINIYNKDEAIAQIEDCLSNPDKIYNSAVFDARRKILLEYNMFKDELKIMSFKFNDLNNIQSNSITDILYDYNSKMEKDKIQNWIELKRFVNKLFINYAG